MQTKNVLTSVVLFYLILLVAPFLHAQEKASQKTLSDSGADHYQFLSELPLDGGYPTEATSRTLHEELYFQQAVQSYLWALPAMNMVAMRDGLGDKFGYGYNVLSVFEKRPKPNTIITTPNSDVIYGLGWADLSKTGPLVMEVPPGLQGLMDDMWHRPLKGPNLNGVQYLGDLGLPGPDKGKGGKYLIVPEGYEGTLDEKNYFVFTSKTNGVFIFLRGFFKSVDNLKPGVEAIESIKIYPLQGERKPMKFAHASDIPANALFSHDFSYFQDLNDFIQGEKLDQDDPYMHGMLASLGIKKGSEFSPSDRQRELLDQAAETAWRMAKNIAANFDEEEKGLWWKDRHWVAHARTEIDDFMHTLLDEEFKDRITGYTDVNAKAHMYINHYSISTGMMSSIVGLGAKYGNAYKDSEGNYLQGANTYKIDLPPNPPAGLFWSLTLYDAETASGIDAEDQVYPSLNSMNDIEFNEDGSITFYVGPEPQEGKKNWIKTVPGRGWFSIIRWYGPTQAFFDRQYKPGDFIRIK
ncbi:CDP-4-dehydro-6-deoxy-D-glucose 3-dehydratase [Planctomycetales bacterium 10988]|nr:CDP-4-dehydro-6-deoxy-D-glucose 3-dehydratase [Planctomycetales bacterium 10988]